MIENEKKICDNLFKYINCTLCDFVDAEIFAKSTLQKIGKFYFNNTIGNVDDAI